MKFLPLQYNVDKNLTNYPLKSIDNNAFLFEDNIFTTLNPNSKEHIINLTSFPPARFIFNLNPFQIVYSDISSADTLNITPSQYIALEPLYFRNVEYISGLNTNIISHYKPIKFFFIRNQLTNNSKYIYNLSFFTFNDSEWLKIIDKYSFLSEDATAIYKVFKPLVDMLYDYTTPGSEILNGILQTFFITISDIYPQNFKNSFYGRLPFIYTDNSGYNYIVPLTGAYEKGANQEIIPLRLDTTRLTEPKFFVLHIFGNQVAPGRYTYEIKQFFPVNVSNQDVRYIDNYSDIYINPDQSTKIIREFSKLKINKIFKDPIYSFKEGASSNTDTTYTSDNLFASLDPRNSDLKNALSSLLKINQGPIAREFQQNIYENAWPLIYWYIYFEGILTSRRFINLASQIQNPFEYLYWPGNAFLSVFQYVRNASSDIAGFSELTNSLQATYFNNQNFTQEVNEALDAYNIPVFGAELNWILNHYLPNNPNKKYIGFIIGFIQDTETLSGSKIEIYNDQQINYQNITSQIIIIPTCNIKLSYSGSFAINNVAYLSLLNQKLYFPNLWLNADIIIYPDINFLKIYGNSKIIPSVLIDSLSYNNIRPRFLTNTFLQLYFENAQYYDNNSAQPSPLPIINNALPLARVLFVFKSLSLNYEKVLKNLKINEKYYKSPGNIEYLHYYYQIDADALKQSSNIPKLITTGGFYNFSDAIIKNPDIINLPSNIDFTAELQLQYCRGAVYAKNFLIYLSILPDSQAYNPQIAKIVAFKYKYGLLKYADLYYNLALSPENIIKYDTTALFILTDKENFTVQNTSISFMLESNLADYTALLDLIAAATSIEPPVVVIKDIGSVPLIDIFSEFLIDIKLPAHSLSYDNKQKFVKWLFYFKDSITIEIDIEVFPLKSQIFKAILPFNSKNVKFYADDRYFIFQIRFRPLDYLPEDIINTLNRNYAGKYKIIFSGINIKL